MSESGYFVGSGSESERQNGEAIVHHPAGQVSHMVGIALDERDAFFPRRERVFIRTGAGRLVF